MGGGHSFNTKTSWQMLWGCMLYVTVFDSRCSSVHSPFLTFLRLCVSRVLTESGQLIGHLHLFLSSHWLSHGPRVGRGLWVLLGALALTPLATNAALPGVSLTYTGRETQGSCVQRLTEV